MAKISHIYLFSLLGRCRCHPAVLFPVGAMCFPRNNKDAPLLSYLRKYRVVFSCKKKVSLASSHFDSKPIARHQLARALFLFHVSSKEKKACMLFMSGTYLSPHYTSQFLTFLLFKRVTEGQSRNGM